MGDLVRKTYNEKKIFLVIDDEADIYEFFKDLCYQSGWEVDWAPDTKKAWELFLNKKYDIIFIDIKIGDENGIELLKKMKKKAPYRSLYVMMTGKATPQEIHDSYTKEGAYTCLCKPFRAKQLLKLIRMMIKIDPKVFYQQHQKHVRKISSSMLTQYISVLILTIIAAFFFIYYNYYYVPKKSDSFFLFLKKKIEKMEGYLQRDEEREIDQRLER